MQWFAKNRIQKEKYSKSLLSTKIQALSHSPSKSERVREPSTRAGYWTQIIDTGVEWRLREAKRQNRLRGRIQFVQVWKWGRSRNYQFRTTKKTIKTNLGKTRSRNPTQKAKLAIPEKEPITPTHSDPTRMLLHPTTSWSYSKCSLLTGSKIAKWSKITILIAILITLPHKQRRSWQRRSSMSLQLRL